MLYKLYPELFKAVSMTTFFKDHSLVDDRHVLLWEVGLIVVALVRLNFVSLGHWIAESHTTSISTEIVLLKLS